MGGFWARLTAIFIKEVRPLARDKLSFVTMFVLPIAELMIFGYAINTDPHNLPTALLTTDQSTISRSVLVALRNTGYMNFIETPASAAEADALMRSGKVQFIVRIPSDFTRRLARGERTQILIDADATDPTTAANPLAAAGPAIDQALRRDLIGPLEPLLSDPGPVELVIHRRYNPESLSSRNIVPGLLAVILSITMVLMTALSVTRERESGTMEHLLALPVRPIEVMIGKVAPYFVVGCVQTTFVLVLAYLLFDITVEGSVLLLSLGAAMFVLVNLVIGFTISTVTRNQVAAMQASFCFLLPSILLSGFMFPFSGMPLWAQTLGELLPTTHFMRIVRGVMLKAADFHDVKAELGALTLILLVVSLIAMARYRLTLDLSSRSG